MPTEYQIGDYVLGAFAAVWLVQFTFAFLAGKFHQAMR